MRGAKPGPGWPVAKAGLLGLLLVVLLATPESAPAQPGTSPAAVAAARQGLAPAIRRFAAFDRRLLAPDRAARAGGRTLRPALTHTRLDRREGSPHAHTALTGGLSRMEVDLYGGFDRVLYIDPPAENVEYGLQTVLGGRAGSMRGSAGAAGAAFVVAGALPKTDLLLRALPYGMSVYALFQSARSPERVHLSAGSIECAPGGFELFRRPMPGLFSWEQELKETEGVECEPYSHAPVGPGRAAGPADTQAAYAAERAMFRAAGRRARRDRAQPLLLLRAYTAHDASGKPVPTEIAWREEGEGAGPVLRVHLVAGHFHFPVLMRFDVITPR